MLIQLIKADQLQARKSKDTVKASLLTTLIGEAETAAKAGKSLEDADVQALIKKFIKNADESLKVANNPVISQELQILKAYLPTQYTADQLKEILTTLKAGGVSSLGEAMKILKSNHAGLYDGGEASKLAKEVFV